MVILGTRNKITDFLMILAWASPFKGRNSLKNWPSEINCSSEYINYRMFKTFLQLGNYLLRLSYQQRTVMRFRCKNIVVLASPVIYEYVHYVMNWVINWVMNCYCRNPVYICTSRPMSLKKKEGLYSFNATIFLKKCYWWNCNAGFLMLEICLHVYMVPL